MSPDELLQAVELATHLTPNCAEGRPLRALPVAGNDTKFIERHRTVITELLDICHEGAASQQGLEVFLGCDPDNHHWLLVADLDGGLLPLKQIRVRDTELTEHALPGERVIVIENERCLHLLPAMPGTIAILGAGLNLAWMSGDWLASRDIAYWGDIDTWGITMLGRARKLQPQLTAMLMDDQTFTQFADMLAVSEPEPVTAKFPIEITPAERALISRLKSCDKGRVEQEFLPVETVRAALTEWLGKTR